MRQSNVEFTKWFGPVLDALRSLGDSGKPGEVCDRIATNLKLPDEILDETLKSGLSRFNNQVAWARQYLTWEGYLDASKYGTWKLTDKGRLASLTQKEADEIFKKWTKIHAENRRKKQSNTNDESIHLDITTDGVTNEDALDLISTLRSLSPLGFEKICKELLRESGFENVEITGGSADGGIDGYGTLEINPFVSFKVLFQCKRYAKGNLVSRA